MRSLRPWQKILEGIDAARLIPEPPPTPEEPETHDHVENYVIVEPPASGEDQEQAHGGDDVCQDVEDAPEREEAQGDSDEGEPQQPSADRQDGDPEQSGSREGVDSETGDGEESEDYDGEGETGEDDGDFSPDPDWEKEAQAEYDHDHREAYSLDLEAARRRRLATTFATVIAKIAEDLSGWPVEGDDEWDVAAIMERRITRRPLSQCRQSREKESVVVILDTSGSCYPQAAFYGQIARLACEAGDVELYTAPNAWLESRRLPSGQWASCDSRNTHGWERFSRRTIIFFGDFDGGNAPVEASRRNKVYWFSCEGNRYADMDEHDWCSYTLAAFRGKYYVCETEADFLRLAKKIR